MSRARVCLVMMMALAWAHAARAQAPPAQPARDRIVHPGDATISGRALEAGSNQPVRNARVHAASPAVPGGRTTYTGADGSFTFHELPPGSYAVTVTKVGWVSGAFGRERVLDAAKAFDVA